MPRFLFMLFFAIAASAAAPKPNILVIYTDDHGWADLGIQGVNSDIRTPQLDQLARDGVRFSRGYVSAPQCVPSRAGLLTGRYQQRFGVDDNNKGPLPLAEVTIAERLKAAGYVTGMCGKWHLDLGGKDGGRGEARLQSDHMPGAQGFDEYWRGEMRTYFASHDLAGKPFPDAPHAVRDDRFRIAVQTEAALAFLDRRKATPTQPWFLYLAWFAPHVPLESPEPWFSRTPANLPLERRQALAMIAAMDDGLGRIRAKLHAMGVATNTLIFFIGDNGAPVKKGAWDGSVNLPLVGEKGMLTDGGVRVPFVAAWPGRFPPGMVCDKPVINLDVAATAVALAGLPPAPELDGTNLVPFLTGERNDAPHETLYWRWRTQAAVLEFPWKLIRLGPSERFLFDVTKPGGEHTNLLGARPEVAARLDAKLKTWSDTLATPGLPTDIHAQDQTFFDDHGVTTGAAPKVDTPAPPHGGWIARNGTLAVQNGELVITPDGKSRPFLTKADLDLKGPVKVLLRVKAPRGGSGTVTWREKGQKDFLPDQTASFELAPRDDWQEAQVEVPATERIIHLRVTPSAGASLPRFGRIELHPGRGEAVIADFTKE